uniref:Uncharacterized protein n=1 Tax=Myoviridae sp. ctVeR24 TaxID=2827689 RepID=A0A8S5SXM1_9CAUD|nr:MAG TPA: hypothetical protein [Myoviridae sp. ctVeR24]
MLLKLVIKEYPIVESGKYSHVQERHVSYFAILRNFA